MDYLEEIRNARSDPQRLESLYRAARRAHEEGAFRAALQACREGSPDCLLYEAWHYRLQPVQEVRGANWLLAVPLAVAAGLLFFLLGDPRLAFPQGSPYLLVFWGPLAALAIMAYLGLSSRRDGRRTLAAGAGLAVITLYAAAWIFGRNLVLSGHIFLSGYRDLMLLHLPLAGAIAVGIAVLGLKPDQRDLYAVLTKAIEVLVTGGVFLIVGGMFAGIAFGLFAALGINITPEITSRVAFAGLGAVPVLAVATVYDPRLAPSEQQFEQGLGKLVPVLTRLLLPLAILVLLGYLVAIPFRFMEPFRSRDVLIVYNAMLFGVMGLLVSVTPMQAENLPERFQSLLRTGILLLAGLAVLISLYALSATVYRTVLGGLTANRLTVIGWNTLNIGILCLAIYRQLKRGAAVWLDSLHSTAAVGIIGYILWTAFLILSVPVLF